MKFLQPVLVEFGSEGIVVGLIGDRSAGLERGEADRKILRAIAERHQAEKGGVEGIFGQAAWSRQGITLERRTPIVESRAFNQFCVSQERDSKRLGSAVRDHPVKVESEQAKQSEASLAGESFGFTMRDRGLFGPVWLVNPSDSLCGAGACSAPSGQIRST